MAEVKPTQLIALSADLFSQMLPFLPQALCDEVRLDAAPVIMPLCWTVTDLAEAVMQVDVPHWDDNGVTPAALDEATRMMQHSHLYTEHSDRDMSHFLRCMVRWHREDRYLLEFDTRLAAMTDLPPTMDTAAIQETTE